MLRLPTGTSASIATRAPAAYVCAAGGSSMITLLSVSGQLLVSGAGGPKGLPVDSGAGGPSPAFPPLPLPSLSLSTYFSYFPLSGVLKRSRDPDRGDLPAPTVSVPWNSAAGVLARHRSPCAYPGCDALVPWNSVAGVHARCCGSAHERAFVRMDQFSGGSFEGSLIPVLVFGPGHRTAWPPFNPLDVLVFANMLVSEFALYVSPSHFSNIPPSRGSRFRRGCSFD